MIVEVTADLELLNPTLTGTERRVSIERFVSTTDGPLQSVFWLFDPSDGPRFDQDRTVVDARQLSRTPEAVLYRATHPADLATVEAYNAAVRSDVLVLDASGDADGWWLKLWAPDRTSLTDFRDTCEREAISIDIRSMYNENPQPVGDLYGLTERQHEVLQLAIQNGYFEIPRESTLADLAGDMDLSSQAASERLRRGMRTLLRNVLAESDPIVDSRLDSDRP